MVPEIHIQHLESSQHPAISVFLDESDAFERGNPAKVVFAAGF